MKSRNGLNRTSRKCLAHLCSVQCGVVVVLLLSASIEGSLEDGSSVLSMITWCSSTLSLPLPHRSYCEGVVVSSPLPHVLHTNSNLPQI